MSDDQKQDGPSPALQEELLLRAALEGVMHTQDGRRVVWWLLEQYGVFLSTFDPDPYQHAYREGLRNAGLMLFEKLHTACPALYHEMVKEKMQEKHEDE